MLDAQVILDNLWVHHVRGHAPDKGHHEFIRRVVRDRMYGPIDRITGEWLRIVHGWDPWNWIHPEDGIEIDAERFWELAQPRGADECWPFRGATNGRYQTVSFQGVKLPAHRVAFFLANGRWPRPLCCHSCDYPPCSNPAHLFEGSHSDNAADRTQKRRGRWDLEKSHEALDR